MKMKCILFSLLYLLACCGIQAQEAADNSMGDIFGGDFDFDSIEMDFLEYDPSGMVRLTGKVVIKSKDLDVECDELWKEADSDKLVAVGKPVKIRNNDINAQSNKFVYDLKTKTSVLEEGKPTVIQRNNGKVTKVSADIITLYQNDKGKMGFTFKRKENSRNRTTIETLPTEDAAGTTGKPVEKAPEAKKVEKNNLDLIPSFVE